MTKSVGIIGLGRIGLKAAEKYLQEGYHVFGCDPNVEAVRVFNNAGGTFCQTPAEVARQCSVILVMVLNDEQVWEVVNGQEGLLKASPGGTVVCMSTIGRATVREVAHRFAQQQTGFIDCPFTGGPARIPSKSLTLIAAGDKTALESVRSTLEVIGRITYAGKDPGDAQAVKHCNQLLVGVTHAAVMEVIILARKLSLDPSLVSSVIGNGIAGSDYFRLLSDSVLSNTPSPGGLGQMCKDMDIVRSTLDGADVNARVAKAAAEYFQAARARGMLKNEGADLIHVVEQLTSD